MIASAREKVKELYAYFNPLVILLDTKSLINKYGYSEKDGMW